jgi:hypothetical protein
MQGRVTPLRVAKVGHKPHHALQIERLWRILRRPHRAIIDKAI